MKAKLYFILIAFLIVSCSTKTSIPDNNKNEDTWSDSKRLAHLKNIQDSTTWDLEMLETDKQMLELGDYGTFELGAFPVPDYDLLGKESFKGIGNKSGEFQISSKKLLMNCFFIKANDLNKDRLKGKTDEVFFQIIVLTDTVDTENYNLDRRMVLSRNHPDYAGQGFIKTKNNRIDYFAFRTAGNDAYAIVNTRIFNLNFGETILIAPQKGKTLRSLQIKSPPTTSGSVIQVTEDLLKQERIKNFFEQESSI